MKEPKITFFELLRLNFSEPFHWVSGQTAAEVPIDWVVLDIDHVRPGNLYLTTGADLTSEIVRRTQNRGGAGIVCLGDCEIDEAARQLEFPIVVIQDEADILAVHRKIITRLSNQRTHLLEREIRVFGQLSRLVMNNEGLGKLSQAIYELSGWSVVIQDKRLRLLASHPSPFLASIWGDILPTLFVFDNLPVALRDREKAGKRFSIHPQALPGDLSRLVVPISVEGVARGYLSLIDINRSLDSLDYIILEQGALAAGIEMARAKAVREAEKKLKGDLLTALLNESISPRDANLWVQNMGLDPVSSHVAIRLAWYGNDHPSRRRLETLVNGEASRLKMTVLVRALETEVICFCEVSPSQSRPEDALSFCNAIFERGKNEYPNSPIHCGVGSFAPDLGAWRFSFRQAGQALEMARRLNERRPLYFQDLSVYRLLLQLEYHPELKSYKDEILGKLLNYEGSDELIRTLEAYFAHNGNLSQAAESLFIHRNTLIYRMERVSEITNLNFDTNETRLAVQLALRIHKMVTRD